MTSLLDIESVSLFTTKQTHDGLKKLYSNPKISQREPITEISARTFGITSTSEQKPNVPLFSQVIHKKPNFLDIWCRILDEEQEKFKS